MPARFALTHSARTTESDQAFAFDREVQITDVVQLACKHQFHSKCIEKWAEHNPRCPQDRRHITTLPHSSNHLHKALLKSIEDNQIDNVREILSTGVLGLGQLSSEDQENPSIISLSYEYWEISADLLRAGVTTQDGEAQFNPGWIYEAGQGVEQDYVEAIRWYRKAADQGCAEAQNSMG